MARSTPLTILPPALVDLDDHGYSLGDYEGAMTRWCHGCGNSAILTALQRLCAEEQLPPEQTVVVSGIGCAARLPHYMGTYGFHGLHGRALPVAEGVRVRRPDLHVFVSTGDGDCCSIGAGHWIHAVRYNMNMTLMLHDNGIYALTKKQASPTSARGLLTSTTPRGAPLEPLNPLSVTLAMPNVSFVAQAADWLPAILYEILLQAHRHRGFSFVRILQRCPNYLVDDMQEYIRHPERMLLLDGPRGLELDDTLRQRFPNQLAHDAGDLAAAADVARRRDTLPLGILYRNPDAACYESLLSAPRRMPVEAKLAALERELDRFTLAGGQPAGQEGQS
jgi:2-oxoglutarate/2-oxoacid ferredoxin oxidoreductase subunit beta